MDPNNNFANAQNAQYSPQIQNVQIQNVQNIPQTQMEVENQAYVSRLEKFMCCCSFQGLARYCCCGCSLKVGVIIICVLGFLQISGLSLSFIGTTVLIPNILILIATFTGYLLVIISTCDLRVCLAYYGYMILASLFWIKLAFYLAVILVLLISSQSIPSNPTYTYVTALTITYYIIYFLIDLGTYFYYLWVIFSFARYLALGDYNAINGVYPIIVHPNNNVVVVVTGRVPDYQQVQNNNNMNSPGMNFGQEENNNARQIEMRQSNQVNNGDQKNLNR